MNPVFKPEISYVICAVARTGSTLLVRGLRATGVAGEPKEHFHGTRLLKELTPLIEEARERFGTEVHPLNVFLERYSTPNGVFGTKFMYSYFRHARRVMEPYIDIARFSDYELVRYLLYEPRYIHLRRRDKLRQAISFYRANQTKVWGRWSTKANPSAPGVAEFDYEAIRRFYDRVRIDEQAWEQFFERNRIQPLELIYEEMASSYAATVRKVLDYLGIREAATVAIGEPLTEKQSDELTDEWVNRYEELDKSIGKSVIRRWFRKLPTFRKVSH